MKTLNQSLVVEAALAGLFAAAFIMPAAAQDAPKGDAPAKPMPVKKAHGHHKMHKKAEAVHCLGINACKGKSECAVEGKSQCKGQNACKGQGWVSLSSAKKCKAKKGTVEMPKAPEAAAPAVVPAAK
ncbi:MAG: hypothetical protein KGJ84_14140 [Elusimicrobia bacterium]|nr:hypothetical protein [Elusimicrobiota bacterium]